ncbi:MAG: hypothetical protein AAF563_24830 [Pseudomonadota bacterium]
MVPLKAVLTGLLCGCCLAWAAEAADGDVLAVCGPLVGVSHLVQGDGVNNVQTGGDLGRMPGETHLVRVAGKPASGFDVQYEEGSALRVISDRAADMLALEIGEERVVLAAVYPIGLVETFHFTGPELTYSRVNHEGGKSDVYTFRATCTWP